MCGIYDSMYLSIGAPHAAVLIKTVECSQAWRISQTYQMFVLTANVRHDDSPLTSFTLRFPLRWAGGQSSWTRSRLGQVGFLSILFRLPVTWKSGQDWDSGDSEESPLPLTTVGTIVIRLILESTTKHCLCCLPLQDGCHPLFFVFTNELSAVQTSGL